jgi:CspA family cold shock protein
MAEPRKTSRKLRPNNISGPPGVSQHIKARDIVGAVKFYNPGLGYGFLEPDSGGPDIFVGAQSIGGFIKGNRIMFDLKEHNGKYSADNLRAVDG